MATKNKKKSAKKKTPAKKSPTKKKPAAKKAKPKTSNVISLSAARETRANKIDWSQYLTPIDDRVLVELTKAEDRTPGGLYIPDMAQTKSNTGKVVAVGPGKRDKKGRRHPLDVRLGEKIMYAEYSGNKLQLEGRDLLLINETDILGVVEP